MKITDDYVFFFTEKDIYSNWYMRDFTVNDITFKCNEQYMMYCKARLFDDNKIAAEILDESTRRIDNRTGKPERLQAFYKRKGREVSGYDEEVWASKRENYVATGAYHKFNQHEDLREAMLSTGTRKFVEASKFDKLWGIGMDMLNPNLMDVSRWGQNLLGKALDKVKYRLQKEYDMAFENKTSSASRPRPR